MKQYDYLRRIVTPLLQIVLMLMSVDLTVLPQIISMIKEINININIILIIKITMISVWTHSPKDCSIATTMLTKESVKNCHRTFALVPVVNVLPQNKKRSKKNHLV